MNLTSSLLWDQLLKYIPAHPLFSEDIFKAYKLRIDLSPANSILKEKISHWNETSPSQKPSDFLDFINAYILSELQKSKTAYSIGRYLEKRVIYGTDRDIHLGLDIGAPAGTAIYCPWEGVIHSFQDNHAPGDYGPTLILSHELSPVGFQTSEPLKFYTLYGHLSRQDLERWTTHKIYHPGDLLGHVGSLDENGGWLPHLHIQIIKNLQDHTQKACWGDYPGICAQEDLAFYQSNTADPLSYLSL